MEKLNVYQKLIKVQVELKAPKNQYNSFGKYSYRNCEDILEALKAILDKYQATVIISDEVIPLGNAKYIIDTHNKDKYGAESKKHIDYDGTLYYVKATVRFIDCESGEMIESSAFAREAIEKKGMDDSQVTGSTSSYARKYALNGMFCIDDTKDADSRDNTDNKIKVTAKATSSTTEKCSCCGTDITEFTYKGVRYTEQQAIDFAKRRGNEKYPLLCGRCEKKIKKEEVK